MKMNRAGVLARWVAIALLALAIPACSTFQYREVQSDFQEAVRADIEERNAVIDRSEGLYQEVVASLTPERINNLDPKLWANAWMIRAYSEWQIGELGKAKESAEKGQGANPVENSRDDVLLHLIPALIIDSDVMNVWVAAGGKTDPVVYADSQENDFKLAIKKVGQAKKRFGPATPVSTKYYVEYQRWRVLQNWRTVVSGIETR